MTRLRVADRVGVVVEGDAVYVARLPDGPILALDGTAEIIWRAALKHPRTSIARFVARRVGVETDDIAAEVDRFVDDLMARGLVTPVERR